MKVGLTNMYAFRPHTEHALYLESLLKLTGAETCFFIAEKEAAMGYPKLLKQSSFIKEYIKNVLGGLRTYPYQKIYTPQTLNRFIKPSGLSVEELQGMVLSSACTLNRIESDAECDDDCIKETLKLLSEPTEKIYSAALAWIEQAQLDAVIVFNGRMDLTRAVIEACKKKNIPFITHERTWFGDGIHLTPNASCLDSSQVNNMVKHYNELPLTKDQAQKAARIIAKRFLRENDFEWRSYNKSAQKADWPTNTKKEKVLILPGSRSEFLGNPSYLSEWEDNTLAIDALCEGLKIKPEQIVVRFHPVWSETVGKIDGEKPRKLYKIWCELNNYHYIDSHEKADTYDLIAAADIVVVNGGSSAIEAGVMGKKIISLREEGSFKNTEFVTFLDTQEKIDNFTAFKTTSQSEMIRGVLRFVYTHYGRFPQFVDQVRLIDATTYRFFNGGDPLRLINILNTYKLTANDQRYAVTDCEESVVVDLIKQQDWKKLASLNVPFSKKEEIYFKRRLGFRWVNYLRGKLPIGHR